MKKRHEIALKYSAVEKIGSVDETDESWNQNKNSETWIEDTTSFASQNFNSQWARKHPLK